MTIEQFVILYLSGHLSVPVSGSVPSPMPDRFVTVEQTGGRRVNKIPSATLAVQSWAGTRAEAAALNAQVEAAMDAMAAEPEISRCALDAASNFTDLATKKPRYQAVFDVVYLF